MSDNVHSEGSNDAMAEALQKSHQAQAHVGLRVIGRDGLPFVERSDEDLMLAHGEGSEEAFAELLKRHQRGVMNYIFRMVQNRQIAEELTQDVFLAIVKNAERYRPTAKFTTYLYTIASNIVSKEWLRRKRRPKFFSMSSLFNRTKDEEFNALEHFKDEKADVLTSFQQGEISEAVNEALRCIPEHQREVFVLRRFQDLSYEEISEVTGVPVGTAKSRVARAEKALRPLLDNFREYL